MKKLLYLLVFAFAFNLIPVISVSAESIMEPQWSEFCPPLYENAVFKKADKSNSKRYMENNYWALRKAKFEKSIAECKAYAKDQVELNTCFSRVANLERNKTAQRSGAKQERNADLDREIFDSGRGYGYYNYWYNY